MSGRISASRERRGEDRRIPIHKKIVGGRELPVQDGQRAGAEFSCSCLSLRDTSCGCVLARQTGPVLHVKRL
jgi:hypothetical protein